MREELEPCPFCGGEAEWRDDPGVCDVPFGLVVAHKDHCFLNHIAFEEADIIAAWNTRAPIEALTERASMAAEIERLREANGILEDGLQEVGDDYPGSSCQEWCQHQIKMARAALEARP